MQTESSRQHSAAFTLTEAALRLGVSQNTVRRRIARGELHAERALRPQGPVWQVFLPATQDAAAASTQHAHGSIPHDAESGQINAFALAVLPIVEAAVAPIRAELADVRAMLSDRDQELGRLRAELAATDTASQRVGRDSANGTHERAQESTVSNKRAWWAFWRTGRALAPAGGDRAER